MAAAVGILAQVPDIEEFLQWNEFSVTVAEVCARSGLAVIVARVGPVVVIVVRSVIWIAGIIIPIHDQKKGRGARFGINIRRVISDRLSQNLLFCLFPAVIRNPVLGREI